MMANVRKFHHQSLLAIHESLVRNMQMQHKHNSE